MNHYVWRLLFVLMPLVLSSGVPSVTKVQAQDSTLLTGQLVGIDGQPIPAQVTIRITYPDGSTNRLDTASDGSFSYTETLEPGTYWLGVDYDSLPDVLRGVIRADDLALSPIMLPAEEPIRLNLLGDRTATAACEQISLVLGTPSTAPVESYRQVIYTLSPLLEVGDLYHGKAYNPLSRSSLTIQTAYVDRNQHAIVLLEGVFTQSEEPCDDVYVREQIEQTVLSVPGIRGVTVFINNQLLDLLIRPVLRSDS